MDRDDELAQEIAAYHLAHPPVKDDGQCVVFASLHGNAPVTDDRKGKALDACATNAKMFKMIKMIRRSKDAETVANFLDRVQARPEYYRRVRAYFGLDFREGWLDRYLAETAN